MFTTRQQIITQLTNKLTEETSIIKILLGDKNSIEKEFNSLTETDFPIIVVEAGLPQLNIKFSKMEEGVIELSRSILPVNVYCYCRCFNGVEDKAIGVLLNDVWKCICNNPNLGGVLKVVPSISQTITYNGSYAYFSIELGLEYVHSALEI